MRCRDCQCELTAEEAQYYEDRCEECEVEWHLRMEAWRAGGTDPELDQMYGAAVEGRPHRLL